MSTTSLTQWFDREGRVFLATDQDKKIFSQIRTLLVEQEASEQRGLAYAKRSAFIKTPKKMHYNGTITVVPSLSHCKKAGAENK
jgi:hypothetical protein